MPRLRAEIVDLTRTSRAILSGRTNPAVHVLHSGGRFTYLTDAEVKRLVDEVLRWRAENDPPTS